MWWTEDGLVLIAGPGLLISSSLISPGYSLGVMLGLVDLSSFVSDAWFSWDCLVRLAIFGLFTIVLFGLRYLFWLALFGFINIIWFG